MPAATSDSPQSSGNGYAPVVYIMLGILCFGWWAQREDTKRLRNELRQIAAQRYARSQSPTYEQASLLDRVRHFEAEIQKMGEEQSVKDAALVETLTSLNQHDLEELRLLSAEQEATNELIEFLDSRGGKYTIDVVTPNWMKEFLREDTYRQITHVELQLSAPEAELERFSHFPTIRSLKLKRGRLSVAALAHLKKLPKLEGLDLDETELTDEGLLVVSDLTSLKELRVRRSTITDAGMSKLGQLKQLRALTIDGSAGITDEGLVYLAGLTELRSLDLHRAKITGVGFEKLTGLDKLEKLWVHRTHLDNRGLRYIGELESLRDLRVDQTNVDDTGILYLKQLKNLRRLQTGRATSPSAVRSLGSFLPDAQIER